MFYNRKKYLLSRIAAIASMVSIAFIFSACNVSKDNLGQKEDDESRKTSEMTTVEKIDKIISDMTVEEMVYQMMFVTPEAITNVHTVIQAGETTKNALQKYPVGGIVYFAQNFETREQTLEMLENTQKFSKIPLFIAVDEEGGTVSRLGKNPKMGITKLPPMEEIGKSGDANKAYEIGETLGEELSGLGFNVDFAPDSDVLINPDNTEIGSRSFGSDPQNVSLMVENVVKGMQKYGVSSTLKHFPGHGSTYLNSHSGYSESKRTLPEMRNSEFLPFVSGIKAGADFVMISHMTPVNITGKKIPASLSEVIITDILKTELRFSGIVISDSFSMGAITEKYSSEEAAVKAVEAGIDMILMPMDLEKAHGAIVDAVKSGEISEERIKESVKKIISLKDKKRMFN